MFFRHSITLLALVFCCASAVAQPALSIDAVDASADVDEAMSLIFSGEVAEVEEMLDKGLDPDAKDEWGSSLLSAAVMASQPDLARLLVKRGADVNSTGEAEKIPVFNSACYGGDLSLCEFLLKQGANPKLADIHGGTALEDAAYSGSEPLVKRLRSLGLTTKWPLHVAAGIGDIESVKRLLSERDANEARKGWYDTPLCFAAAGGHADVVKLLLEADANPNLPDKPGLFPLHYAVGDDSLGICKQLVEAGADVNAYVGESEPPLSWAKGDQVKEYLRGQGAKTAEELSYKAGPSLLHYWQDQLLHGTQPNKRK